MLIGFIFFNLFNIKTTIILEHNKRNKCNEHFAFITGLYKKCNSLSKRLFKLLYEYIKKGLNKHSDLQDKILKKGKSINPDNILLDLSHI